MEKVTKTCNHCKTRANQKSKIKFISCTDCNEFTICGSCFDFFIYPRLINYKFVNSKFDPTLVPVESYSTTEDEIFYANATNHIIQNKCPKCTATNCMELHFTFLENKTKEKEKEKEKEKSANLINKNATLKSSITQQLKCMRQYETIISIQDIYKTMYIEFNNKKSPYFLQLLSNPFSNSFNSSSSSSSSSFKLELHSSTSPEQHYILNNKEDDFADYRTCMLLSSIVDDDVQGANFYILKNVILKHSIFKGSDLLFFIHEAKLLGLEKLLHVLRNSSFLKNDISNNASSFEFEFEFFNVETQWTRNIYQQLLDYYEKELFIHCLKLNCNYCYTCYNLPFDPLQHQFITKRTYLVENLKRNVYSFPCFSCKRNLNLHFKNRDDIEDDLSIAYELYFALLTPEEIKTFYLHDPFYENCYDIANDSRISFWYIVKRIEYFYWNVWKKHTHHIFFQHQKPRNNKKNTNKNNKKMEKGKEYKSHRFFDLVFSNPNQLTFFEWIVIGIIGEYLHFDAETRSKIVLKHQPSFQFTIQSNLLLLHKPNPKITMLDIHNFAHLTSLKAFIHSI